MKLLRVFCFYKKSAQEIIEQNNYVKMKLSSLISQISLELFHKFHKLHLNFFIFT